MTRRSGVQDAGFVSVGQESAEVPRVNLLADEGALGNGLQGTDPPAHLGCTVELQAHPRDGEGVILSVGHLEGPRGMGGGGEAGCRGGRLT